MKRLLITGVCGFVAKHFIDFLESRQIKSEIYGIDVLDHYPVKVYRYIQLTYNKLDLLDKDALDNILYRFRPDYILHLASYSSVAFSWKNPVLSFQNNTNIFLNLVETVRKYALQTRILSIGSSEEYGNVNGHLLPLEESSKLDPLSPYAVARVSQELLSKIYSMAFGLDIVITRSFNHIGPYQSDAFVVSSFIKRAVEAKKSGESKIDLYTGNLNIVRDFLDVRDVVCAYYALLLKGKKGEIYNVCSGKGIRLFDILEIIEKYVEIGIHPVLNRKLIRPMDNKIIIGSNKKLIADVGWTPSVSLDESIRDMVIYWEQMV